MGLSDLFSSGGSEQRSNSGFAEGFDKGRASYTSTEGLTSLYDSANDLYRNHAVPQFNMSTRIPGLFKEQEGAANVFANNMFSKASAGGALRGQFSQSNTPGIVGSAITNMGATLFPMINQNLQTAALIPEQIRTQRFNNVMSPLQALISGLGGSASGQTAGPGLGYVGAGSFLKSFGEGLGGAAASGGQGGGLSGMAGKLF